MNQIFSGGRRRWLAALGGMVAAVGLARADRASATMPTAAPADPDERLRL
jgi:hypothetical protein